MEELTQYIKAVSRFWWRFYTASDAGLKAIQRFPNQFIPLALTFCGIGTGLSVGRYRAMPATATGQPLCLKVWCRVSCVRACRSI